MALGAMALLRAALLAAPPPTPWEAGEPLPLRPEELRGADFRLLPGVGPVLAELLEAARIAAGGRLDEAALSRVEGVGPATLRRWEPLWAK